VQGEDFDNEEVKIVFPKQVTNQTMKETKIKANPFLLNNFTTKKISPLQI
jgi:hypothetical protein